MHDLRVELHAVKAPRIVGNSGKGAIGGGPDNAKAGGKLHHPVAMAHPDLVLLTRLPKPME